MDQEKMTNGDLKYTAIIAEYKELQEALKSHTDYQIESHANIKMTLNAIEKHLATLNDKVATNVLNIEELKCWRVEKETMEKIINKLKEKEQIERNKKERQEFERCLHAEKEKRKDRRLLIGVILGLVANILLNIFI